MFYRYQLSGVCHLPLILKIISPVGYFIHSDEEFLSIFVRKNLV